MKKAISFWLTPLSVCVTAMLVGLLLMCSAKRARRGRALVITGLALLVVFSNKWVSWHLIRPLETRYPAQPEFVAGAPLPPRLAACRYVVVLGGGSGDSPGVSANNLLSGSALARIVEGVRILRVLPEAKLIVTGPGPEHRESHAMILAHAAQALGIAADRMLYIDQARDTEEESQAAREIVGRAPVALVTSAWHMPRSVALFRNAGLDPLPCPADFQSHAHDGFYLASLLWETEALGKSSLALRERIGYLWIWLRGKT